MTMLFTGVRHNSHSPNPSCLSFCQSCSTLFIYRPIHLPLCLDHPPPPLDLRRSTSAARPPPLILHRSSSTARPPSTAILHHVDRHARLPARRAIHRALAAQAVAPAHASPRPANPLEGLCAVRAITALHRRLARSPHRGRGRHAGQLCPQLVAFFCAAGRPGRATVRPARQEPVRAATTSRPNVKHPSQSLLIPSDTPNYFAASHHHSTT